ncbi:MAG: tRNA (guanine(46)-N(7))-methyltransferase TrmB [Nocardioides sp.]
MRARTTEPARPQGQLTADGRHTRDVRSYSRRGHRLTTGQQAAWSAYADHWVIPEEAMAAEGSDPVHWFGRTGPLAVEIGSGVGDATAALAALRPEWNVLAFEVWRPGVATTLSRLAATGVTNVRLSGMDAGWAFQHRLRPESVTELWTFFPDPWPKKRHRKRRLITVPFARLAASKLMTGGRWRLATDWPDYAEQITEVLGSCEGLSGGVVSRWDERPVTKFERRARLADRAIVDFDYLVTRQPATSSR